jgi:UrcA family protein
MLSMKSVASALLLAATAADLAVPVMVAPALVLAASTAARAAPAETPAKVVRQQILSYRDLNLAAPSGMAAFEARVKAAAEDVCGPQADVRNFDEAADYRACVAKAVQGAMSTLPAVRQQASQPSHAG